MRDRKELPVKPAFQKSAILTEPQPRYTFYGKFGWLHWMYLHSTIKSGQQWGSVAEDELNDTAGPKCHANRPFPARPACPLPAESQARSMRRKGSAWRSRFPEIPLSERCSPASAVSSVGPSALPLQIFASRRIRTFGRHRDRFLPPKNKQTQKVTRQ